MIRWLALILVSLGLLTAEAEEQRMALLIGNQSYDTEGLSPLHNPHGDVDRVAAALRQAGFADVVVLKDQDESQMREAIMAFAAKLSDAGEDGIGFFYYSGHGAALEKEDRTRVSYLIPTGEPVTYAEQLESYGVPLTDQVNRLSSTGAGAVFVVIDACRNELDYRFRKSPGMKGLAIEEPPGSILIAYAAEYGYWADDDSVFSTALAAEIVKPGQPAETAFANMSRAVGAKKVGLGRLPVVQSRLSRRVCFSGCQAADNAESQNVADSQQDSSSAVLFGRSYGDYESSNIDLAAWDLTTLCFGGSSKSCNDLAYLKEKGLIEKESDADIVLLYAKACAGEDVLGCGNSGRLLYQGFAGAYDEETGIKLMRWSCDNGSRYYCNWLRRDQ